MNIDEAVARLGAGAGESKKKRPEPADPHPRASSVKPPAPGGEDMLELIASSLPPATAGLVRTAKSVRLDGDVLTISFSSGAMSTKMLESNGRLQQIEKTISNHIGRRLTVRLAETDKDEEKKTTPSERLNRLSADPAVKAVLSGLDATITRIEQT
jgi:hypothetical protein